MASESGWIQSTLCFPDTEVNEMMPLIGENSSIKPITIQSVSSWTARMERYYSPPMPPARLPKKIPISSKRLERLAAEDPDLAILRIGKVSQYTGLSASAVRKYETLGLLLPRLTRSAQRLYSPRDVAWLLQVQAFQQSTSLGPLTVRYLIRLIPNKKVRQVFLDSPCSYDMDSDICWKSAMNNGEMRSVCRNCPTYQRKDMALDIRKYFMLQMLGQEK